MFPHFLCIGAQKAGTSWLYDALRAHPEVWVPPVKEFHYFDLPGPLPTAVLTAHRARFRLHLRKMFEARRALRHDDARWLRTYLFAPRSDRWYGQLFERHPGRVCGDITPAYARLDDRAVERVGALMHHARLIYILRDPIGRAWSQIRMDWGRRGRLTHADERSIIRYLQSDHADRNGRYDQVIDRWTQHFAPGALHVDFFEAIAREPHAFLSRIYTHLRLNQTGGPYPPDPTRVRNASDAADMPPAVARHLGERYLPVTQALLARFPNPYTADWHQRAVALAAQ